MSSPPLTPKQPMKVAQNPAVAAAMTRCVKCGAQWGGLKTAHCPTCHETFTTGLNFDCHRAGSHAADTRHCLPPLSVGLVDAGRAYPCWSQAGRSEEAEQ